VSERSERTNVKEQLPPKAGAMADLGRRAKAASRTLATASTGAKDAALHAAADLLVDRAPEILEANAEDVERAQSDGVTSTVVDRLRLNTTRIEGMASGLRKVAALADPVGEIVEGWTRPNGLVIEKVRVPLGVVAIVYENRPNVTSDAFGLCLKSGNAAFLRGSSGALRSNVAIAGVLREGLTKAGLPPDALLLVEDTSYEAATEFMQLRDSIDCLIPRGGPSLIKAVLDNATVPYVIDGDGNCHVYVDQHADLAQALDIVVNAKTQRPSVCNAAESLVVHESVAREFLPRALHALDGVELVGDDASRAIADSITAATDDDFGTEFLGLKMSVAVVPSLDAAIEHINTFGSGHTEAICTTDVDTARRFEREVDAAAVIVNASTRFTDGEEFGFGAEIGISTQKLHARGPMGLRELTTTKYVVHGEGQIRT
jgi:glutamate-5-semialdehyde dehydrogenase